MSWCTKNWWRPCSPTDTIVPTALLASPDVMPLEGVVAAEDVYARDVRWITECDFLLGGGQHTFTWGGIRDWLCPFAGEKGTVPVPQRSQGVQDDPGQPSPQTHRSYAMRTPDQAVQLLTAYLENLPGPRPDEQEASWRGLAHTPCGGYSPFIGGCSSKSRRLKSWPIASSGHWGS